MKEIRRLPSSGYTFIFEIDHYLYPLYKYLMRESTDTSTCLIFKKLIESSSLTRESLEDILFERQKTFPENMDQFTAELLFSMNFYLSAYPKLSNTVRVRIRASEKAMAANILNKKLSFNIGFAQLIFEGLDFPALLYELGHHTRLNISLNKRLSKKLKHARLLSIEKKHSNLLKPLEFSKGYNILSAFFIDHVIQKNIETVFCLSTDPSEALGFYTTLLEDTDMVVYDFFICDSLRERGDLNFCYVFILSLCDFFVPAFTFLVDRTAPEMSGEFNSKWLERIHALSLSDKRSASPEANTAFVKHRRKELLQVIKATPQPELTIKRLDLLSRDIIELKNRYDEIIKKGVCTKEILFDKKKVALYSFNDKGVEKIASFVNRFYERADYWLQIDQKLFEVEMKSLLPKKLHYFVKLHKALRRLNALKARMTFSRIECV